jgi:hypothetical protein
VCQKLSFYQEGGPMITPDRKVRKLMEEYEKTGNLSKSALRADVDRKTARKYLTAGKLPSEMPIDRTWRTREDPFSEHWETCQAMFDESPELEAKAVFEWMCREYPGSYQEGQLRTFQRRVRQWRTLSGPEQEVFFAQEHKPGVRMSTDFTYMDELGVTIAGEAFSHRLCHCVLTYSNWAWGSICHSESLLSLRTGIQNALTRLGHVPKEHWTDHSSAATHLTWPIATPLRSVAALRAARLPSVGSAPRSLFHLEPAICALKVRLWTHSLRTSSEFNGQLWVM